MMSKTNQKFSTPSKPNNKDSNENINKAISTISTADSLNAQIDNKELQTKKAILVISATLVEIVNENKNNKSKFYTIIKIN